jgi:formylglycine-generating enzyme required for sulfatase activity
MKRIVVASFLLSAAGAFAAGDYVGAVPLVVGNVRATVDSGTHLLRVTYDLTNENDEPAYVTLDVQTNGVSIGWDKVRTLSGDVTKLSDPQPVACGTGKSLVWNAPADWSGNLGSGVTVNVKAHYTNAIARIPGVYMKIDVSGGADAASYPVSYVFAGPDLTDATKPYAKDFIWLRCIGPGSFLMGAPTGETGRRANEVLHGVTMTKPFYIGVFEVTEYQYKQVMGALPSGLTAPWGDEKPVTQCSYNILRGTTYSWPASSEVDASTFIGRLRAKTGLAFDLPTEAQWEYSCRAGVQAALHNGKDAATGNDEASSWWMRYIAYFKGNRVGSGPAAVGTKAPNNWLLYDMIGNVYELVLDWYAADVSAYKVDPTGPATGTSRILRSGAYDADYNWERSAFRLDWKPASTHQALGFRLGMSLD